MISGMDNEISEERVEKRHRGFAIASKHNYPKELNK